MRPLRSIIGVFLCLFAAPFAYPQFASATPDCPVGIAHRGNAFAEGPAENSIGAFITAFAVGSKWIETDVHFTSDSVPVIMHNATVDATTDGTGAIASMTAAQFRSLHLSDGQHPPTLDQVLAVVSAVPKGRLLLEIKARNLTSAHEEILLRKLKGRESKVHLMAFADRFPTVQHLKSANPDFTISILGYDPIIPPPAGIVSENLEHTYITPAHVQQLHSLGLEVKAWSVDNATAWQTLRDMGVDAIITNRIYEYLAWARATCGEKLAPVVSLTAPVAGRKVSDLQPTPG